MRVIDRVVFVARMGWKLIMPSNSFSFRIESASVVVNVRSREILFDRIRLRLSSGQGFSVATVNLDHVVKLRADANFRDSYAHQDFVVADGHPVVWLSRLAGRPVELVAGADIIAPLAQLAAEARVPLALFGSTEAVLAGAEAALKRTIPTLRIAARIAPPMGFKVASAEADAAIEGLRRSGARLVLVALGAPLQENFTARARECLPDVGFVSIGAGLDFLTGHQRRAPLWMRRLQLEWLWRMAYNPRRLTKRYLKCIAILPRLTLAVALQRQADPQLEPLDGANSAQSWDLRPPTLDIESGGVPPP